jgi:hypothetical protein
MWLCYLQSLQSTQPHRPSTRWLCHLHEKHSTTSQNDTFSGLEDCEDRLVIMHGDTLSCKENFPFLQIIKSFENFKQILHTLPFIRHHPNKDSFLKISFFSAPFISMYSYSITSENKESLCFSFPLNFSPWSNFYFNITTMKIFGYFSFVRSIEI